MSKYALLFFSINLYDSVIVLFRVCWLAGGSGRGWGGDGIGGEVGVSAERGRDRGIKP